jgi:hypothetical protein
VILDALTAYAFAAAWLPSAVAVLEIFIFLAFFHIKLHLIIF